MNPKLKITAHILVFLAALAVFWAGLGLGLQYSIAIGPLNIATVMLIAATAIAALNIAWIARDQQQHR